jgi:hypothetical protein
MKWWLGLYPFLTELLLQQIIHLLRVFFALGARMISLIICNQPSRVEAQEFAGLIYKH